MLLFLYHLYATGGWGPELRLYSVFSSYRLRVGGKRAGEQPVFFEPHGILMLACDRGGHIYTRPLILLLFNSPSEH